MKEENQCEVLDEIIRRIPTETIKIGGTLIREDDNNYLGYYIAGAAKMATSGELSAEKRLDYLTEIIDLFEKANKLSKNNLEIIKSLSQAYSLRYQALRDTNKPDKECREHKKRAELYRNKYHKLINKD